MPGDLVPRPAITPLPVPATLSPLQRRGAAVSEDAGGSQIARYIAALKRYKWLILVIMVAGTAAGVGATKLIVPAYETHATMIITIETEGQGRSGPIRAGGLMNSTAWPELLRSFAILDRVALKVPLYVRPREMKDTVLFASMTPSDQLRPGQYSLHVMDGGRYELRIAGGASIESGALGDSIGRSIGVRWQPPAALLAGHQPVEFNLRTPRAAAVQLRDQLVTPPMRERSSLLRLSLTGSDPKLTAKTLNVVAQEFAATAAEIKKLNIVETARTLRDQLAYAEKELHESETSLEQFKVATITLPAEGGPIAAGVSDTRMPVFNNFFKQKIDYDEVRHDRESLERSFAAVREGKLSINSLFAIPAVNLHGQDLRVVLNEYTVAETKLRSLRQLYTDAHPSVQEASQALETMRTQVIPPKMDALLEQLRGRERDLAARIGNTGNELQQIPTRTIEEMRLTRNVRVRENLYQTLKNRYEEAKLAEASSAPDLRVLDTAVAPQWPTTNTAPRLMLMAIFGSFGAAILLAILLDRFDRRFRYPDQATRELGLDILATVPRIKTKRRRSAELEQAAQVVESFRALRLGVAHAAGDATPLSLTITSPGPNDGKSLVAANLALSFAEAGYRTLLVDGDIRRGQLHTVFGVERVPGLIDHLRGTAGAAETLRPTSSPNLTLLTSGTRLRTGQELLVSAALPALFAELRHHYDVILFDSAPMGVGVDAFALGIASQNVALVLRAGTTDRHLARAKLEVMDRLPLRVIGAILNDVQSKDTAYKYYSYLESYNYRDDEQVKESKGRVEVMAGAD
jgi:capsular exopolysaccharide synthesis family protein